MEFGVQLVRPEPPYKGLWAQLEFDHDAFARSAPHQDWEALDDVTGYLIAPKESFKSDVPTLDPEGEFEYESHRAQMLEFERVYQTREKKWLDTGVCDDPHVYFSTDTDWLDEARDPWTTRQRGKLDPDDAVHLLLGGRDGYVEIIATTFSWKLWEEGHPKLNDVSGEPVLEGRWELPPKTLTGGI